MANVRRVAEVLLRVRSRGLLCHSLHLGIATDALGSLRRVSGSRTLVTVVPPAFGACIDGSGHLPCSVAYLTGLCTTEGTPRIVAPGLFCLSLGCHLLIGHNVQAHPRLPVARLLQGAKRPSRRRDAGSRWVQRLVRHYSLSVLRNLMTRTMTHPKVKTSNGMVNKITFPLSKCGGAIWLAATIMCEKNTCQIRNALPNHNEEVKRKSQAFL